MEPVRVAYNLSSCILLGILFCRKYGFILNLATMRGIRRVNGRSIKGRVSQQDGVRDEMEFSGAISDADTTPSGTWNFSSSTGM